MEGINVVENDNIMHQTAVNLLHERGVKEEDIAELVLFLQKKIYCRPELRRMY